MDISSIYSICNSRYFSRSVICVFVILLFCVQNTGCQGEGAVKSKYVYMKPEYDLVKLISTGDTMHFSLTEDMYNVIKSFNVFEDNGREFISFYDQRSQSVNIFNLESKLLEKRIFLKDWFKKHRLYKTSVYVKNFDSIFVNNETSLTLFNGVGRAIKSIGFLKSPPFSWAAFENPAPPVFRKGLLFAGIRPYVKESSFNALSKWKIFYQFDIKNGSAISHYGLPQTYRENYYGYRFLDYSYCYNDRGKFIISFPADTNIYVTDLADYNVAYYAKSQHQSAAIEPVRKSILSDNEAAFKAYLTRDSYGPIYFDPYRKRYLRIAKSGITEHDYLVKNRRKKQRVIVFDEQLRIIGESDIDGDVSSSAIFLNKNGEMFARTKASDEYALHFVKLVYTDGPDGDIRTAQKR